MTQFLNKNHIQKLQRANTQQIFLQLLSQYLKYDKSQIMFTKNLYSFCTKQNYNCQQKQLLINTSLNLLQKIPHHKVQKIQFVKELEQTIIKLSKRKINQFAAYFSLKESYDCLQFLKEQIMPFYQFYECSLEKGAKFGIQCQIFDPIRNIKQNPIVKGNVVDVTTIGLLKGYVGQKPPQQIKPDPPKKK